MVERRHVSLNLRVRGLEQSPTLRIQEEVRNRRARGRRVVNLGLGQSPFPVPTHVVDALRLNASKKAYLPVRGLPELREAIAAYHRKKDNVEANAQEILVGPGSKELLFLLQLCFYGEIIVPTPCWVSYTPQSQIVGRQVRFVPTTRKNHWKIDADRLAEQLEADHDPLRPRLLVLNSPANPTGVSYRDQELRAIADVAREYQVLVLSDEIYSGLHHTGEHISIARYYPEGTIIANGISKWAGAGGWRLGHFRFPPEATWLLDAMAAVASETYTSVNAPVQYAAVRAFEGGMQMEQYLHHARRLLRALTDDAVKRLESADIRVVKPDGAFYLFPDLKPHAARLKRRGIRTGAAMTRALLEEAGVAVLPGSDFNREAGELTARVSLVDFDGAEALTRSTTIPLDETLPQEFLENCTKNVLDGVDRICSWVQQDGPKTDGARA